MTLGLAVRAGDLRRLRADVRAVDRFDSQNVAIREFGRGDAGPSAAGRVAGWLWRRGALDRVVGPLAGFAADGAASSTNGLIALARRRGWQGIVLASQARLAAAPGRLHALIDLYRGGELDIVYDGDDPDWSEVVSVETLERYAPWARARFGRAEYPHRFYHFQRECTPRVGHIGLPHRDYCFNGSFILPGGGRSVGDQGNITPRLDVIPNLDGQTFLDIGCEEGYAVFDALRKGASAATGVNIREASEYDLFPEHRRSEFSSPTVRSESDKERTFSWLKSIYGYGDDQARLKYQNIYQLGSETYDVVFCFGVMYHLKDPFKAVENLYAATRRTLLLESQGIPDSNRSYRERAIHRLRRPFGHGGAVLPPTRRPIAEFDPGLFNMWLFSPELIVTLLRQVGFRDVTILRWPRYRKDSLFLKAVKS